MVYNQRMRSIRFDQRPIGFEVFSVNSAVDRLIAAKERLGLKFDQRLS
jgi:hypothetical protein